MRVLIGIDDTDDAISDSSTSLLACELGASLADAAQFIGCVEHRLHGGVSATTNNQASCLVLDCERDALDRLFERVVAGVEARAAPSSAPGVVLACDDAGDLIGFGREASRREIGADETAAILAHRRIAGFGSRRGLVGAAAAVGLTTRGWSGRWVGFAGLREAACVMQVRELSALGVALVSLETDAEAPGPNDRVMHGWSEPLLVGRRAVLPLRRVGVGLWAAVSANKDRPELHRD
ncbi:MULTISPECIES: hypothetical protein [Methylosinus]|uniref:Uncharacterized protein n=1 Tax=Methylosinus trichosporium (strain ATCC 35070 / NCIMB 11131 / UNIQEM 75 / OB3b) TaxID=595536 RepID=A0A2D2CZF5_METT3|nr:MULTISPECIES: hypothetical protein [Methylosinus]ATQ68117.1 hypothetical protein CQW49_09650 [Methylosinus trichosporium OB3b]OBS53504.1 hypothetical protein A8B73_05465 [Methylosinus sp. 3S-1]